MIQNSCHSCLDNPSVIFFSNPCTFPTAKCPHHFMNPLRDINATLQPCSLFIYFHQYRASSGPKQIYSYGCLHNSSSQCRLKGFCTYDEYCKYLILTLSSFSHSVKDIKCSSKWDSIWGFQVVGFFFIWQFFMLNQKTHSKISYYHADLSVAQSHNNEISFCW